MSEDQDQQDLWTLLDQNIQESQNKPNEWPTILNYPKSIPDIRLNPATFGLAQPDIFLGEQQNSNLLLPSQMLMSRTMLKSRCVLDELVEMMDEQGPIEIPRYNPHFHKMLIRSDQKNYDSTQLSQLLESTVYDDLLPGVETTLFTNNNLFNDQVESVGTAFLSKELKNYSLTNAIDKTSLTKERKNPLTTKLAVSKEVLNIEGLFSEAKDMGQHFLSEQTAAALNLQPKEDLNRKNIIYWQLSANAKCVSFENCWSKYVEDTSDKIFKVQEEIQQIEESKEDKQFSVFQQKEDAIISQEDIKFLSNMADLQKEIEITAKKQQIETITRKEQEEREEEEEEEEDFQYEHEDFIEQTFFTGRQGVEIQEQDPEIRKQIEEALAIKTKFKIIKSSTLLSENQKRMDLSTHKWAIEDESNMSGFYDILPKNKMARQYKFELDDFQKRSVLHLEKRESILVCAHTSAGKTVVAEYAIALALKHNRRALYTSPIKALSNQKYREFEQKFGESEVGVVTGDVSINPSASCLILTTEILRNMLYRGAEMVRDIEWVVFDEVHYVNDAERGMVWEETIIMLPSHVGIIMLSATVPNHMDFANWVGRTKKRPIYVMKTFVRPVPLEHHLYLFDKFHMIKEKEGSLLLQEYNTLKCQIESVSAEQRNEKERIKKALEEKKEDDLYKNTSRSQRAKFTQKALKSRFIQNVSMDSMRFKEEKRSLIQLIRLCDKKELLPAVVFVFSKKKISEIAEAFIKTTGFKLIDHRTENTIINFYDKALHKLKPADRKSPQLLKLRELIRYGVAMHHSGLLPIAKEIVEMLFGEGLIKVLLATETFAMGINMPTKTVIFHSIEKYDNSGPRNLLSSEYTQMSGRAGRRGLDEKGTVIIFVKDPKKLPQPMTLTKMVDHKGQELQSKFKITYRIILNLLTSKDLDAAEMMKRSFHENYRFQQIPRNIIKLERLRKEYVDSSLVQCPYVKGIRSGLQKPFIDIYNEIQANFRSNEIDFIYNVLERSKQIVSLPRYLLFMDHLGNVSLGVAIQLQYLKDNETLKRDYVFQPSGKHYYRIQVLTIHSSRDSPRSSFRYKKLSLSYENKLKVTPKQIRNKYDMYYTISEITEEDILDFLTEQPTQISKGYMNTQDVMFDDFASQLLEKQLMFDNLPDIINFIYNPPSQSKTKAKGKQGPTLTRLKYRFNKEAVNELQAGQKDDDEDEMKSYFKHRDESIQEILKHQCQNCDLKEAHIKQVERKNRTKKELEEIKKNISQGDIEASSDFQNKLSVLKRLGYIDAAGLPLIKARISREIQDASSIYICELLVENIMDTLSPTQIASLLSSFVTQSRGGKKDQEMDGERLLLSQLEQIQLDLPYELYNALVSTLELVKKIVEEESLLGAIENPDVGVQIKAALDFSMCLPLYSWAKGALFVDVCYETDIEEGQIVMTILRLESLLRSIKNSYRVIGNLTMVDKVEKASFLIKKDIVFAESLYFDTNAKVTKQQLS